MASENANNCQSKRQSAIIELEIQWLEIQAYFHKEEIEAEKDYLREKFMLLKRMEYGKSQTSRHDIAESHDTPDLPIVSTDSTAPISMSSVQSSILPSTPVVSTRTIAPTSVHSFRMEVERKSTVTIRMKFEETQPYVLKVIKNRATVSKPFIFVGTPLKLHRIQIKNKQVRSVWLIGRVTATVCRLFGSSNFCRVGCHILTLKLIWLFTGGGMLPQPLCSRAAYSLVKQPAHLCAHSIYNRYLSHTKDDQSISYKIDQL